MERCKRCGSRAGIVHPVTLEPMRKCQACGEKVGPQEREIHTLSGLIVLAHALHGAMEEAGR